VSGRVFTEEEISRAVERTGLSRMEASRILCEWNRHPFDDVDDIIDEWEDAPSY